MTEQPQELVWLNNSAAISVRLSEFPAGSGQYGIDIRKYISGERYSGFTKKGIWVPVESRNDEPIFKNVLQACVKVFCDHKGLAYEHFLVYLAEQMEGKQYKVTVQGKLNDVNEGESAKD